MIIAARVKHFLDSHQVNYRVFMHERTYSLEESVRMLRIPSKQVLQGILLEDKLGVALAVLPLDQAMDLVVFSKKTGRTWKVVEEREVDKFFDDCEPGSHPPLGKAYDISVMLDKSVENLETVYLEAGCHTALIQLSKDDFRFLMEGTPSISFAIPKNESEGLSICLKSPHEIKVDFPALPLIARQILEIAHSTSDEAVSTLSNLISNDEVIRTHILGCVHHFLKEGDTVAKDDELEEIINNILGFNTVSHIAVGVTAGRAFQILEEGPLGLYSFWRHAVHAATLAKKIAERIPSEYCIDQQFCYLAGFFHNFGYLLLGHLFPPEFRLLNRWLLLHPKTAVEVLEKRLVGMGKAMAIIGNGHARLGGWLMQHWGMPEVIVTTTQYHHTPNYQGAFSNYVMLIQLTNQLLRAIGLGDGQSGKVKPEMYQALGLTPAIVEECVESVQSDMKVLDQMAMALAN